MSVLDKKRLFDRVPAGAALDGRLAALSGGESEDVLLLLHGLGATADVWRRCLERLPAFWPGRWLAPDLPGHGSSPWTHRYAAGAQAAAIAQLVPDGQRVYVLAHSLGGALGVLLASNWFGIDVRAVVAFGVKVNWSAQERVVMARRASASPKAFASRDEAVDFYLKVSGLAGLVLRDDPVAAYGVLEDATGWRLAADPATACVGALPVASMLAVANCPVVLAAGRLDPMVGIDELRGLGHTAVDLGAVGHNPHVENPERVLDLIRHLTDAGAEI
ncbi:alpha/beta hydrolase [Paraburkholderia acidicola]|uniref:Alpha/beta hydrolase n=1 Tax=Paraburkholderia acidicola TaxID=1912599 RepID=A0ABV1LVG9_9BURK